MEFVCPECSRVYPGPGHCTEDGARLNDKAACPLLGEWVGSYRIATLIGQGGMGEVYRGIQPEIGSRVAIKLLSGDAARAPAMVDRFFAEARAVNVARHEGIVSVLDLARLPDGRPYIVMEYLEGAPLARVFAEHQPVPLGALLSILLGVLEALGAAHERGITHRDVKPDNVFVTTTGRTKVLDFGIAKLRPEISGISDATRTGALLGTPYYMSPEQARGLPVDHRSDLYSLGVIAFEGVTGRRPFDASNLFDLLRQHIEVPPPSLRSLRPDAPAALEAVIARMLEKDPARRFQSAGELAAALRQTAPFLPAESFVTLTGQPSLAPLPMLSAGSHSGPTAPGYAATLPERGTSASARAKGANWTLIALAGLGALGLVALVSAGLALVVFGDRDTVTIVETPVPPGAASSSASEPSAPSPEAIDLAHVDPIKFFPHAKALAQKQLPGSELSTLVVESPGKDGIVDVSDEGSVVYSFVKRDAPGGQCSVTVSLTGDAPTVAFVPFPVCMGGTVRAPRCSIAKVLKAAGAAPADATLTYGPAESWTIIDGSDNVRMVPDNC